MSESLLTFTVSDKDLSKVKIRALQSSTSLDQTIKKRVGVLELDMNHFPAHIDWIESSQSGTGTQLIIAAANYLSDHGEEYMESTVLHTNKRSINLHERFGGEVTNEGNRSNTYRLYVDKILQIAQELESQTIER